MGAVPVPRTWVDGETPTYATIDADISQTLAFLLQPPMCRVRQTAAQTLSNAVFTAITFQAEDVDPYNWHSSTTNTTRITPTFPGWYRCWYSIGFNGALGGQSRTGNINKNGANATARRDQRPPITAGSTVRSLRSNPFFLPMNGTTDYFEVIAYQDSGASMLLYNTPVHGSEFFCRWWGPL